MSTGGSRLNRRTLSATRPTRHLVCRDHQNHTQHSTCVPAVKPIMGKMRGTAIHDLRCPLESRLDRAASHPAYFVLHPLAYGSEHVTAEDGTPGVDICGQFQHDTQAGRGGWYLVECYPCFRRPKSLLNAPCWASASCCSSQMMSAACCPMIAA